MSARLRLPEWLTAVLLVLLTVVVYWPATGFDFVNYDDPAYVTENPRVRAGLSWAGLAWAFGQLHGEVTYWHPLTWMSHMVDCQLHGLRPWGHHLTSVLLHAINAALVFLVFRRMTGAFWRCVILAALFAMHPLQVDTVAWVTERKNLLGALFWLLTTWAYVSYVEARGRQTESATSLRAVRFYLLALLLFAAGLMCKPVLVTLPFAFLLLDYWPLQRLQRPAPSHQSATRSHSRPAASQLPARPQIRPRDRSDVGLLLREKVPFLALAVASSVITFLGHQALGSLDTVSKLPWGIRWENALVSYVRYLGKTLWPERLAVFYPYPAAWPVWEVTGAAMLLLLISALVLGSAQTRPWLIVGWCWFLGVLVPFSGLVQAGAQAMADRFMYLPILGVLCALIWGLCGLARGGRYQRIAWSAAGAVAILLCLLLTRQQLGYWRDSESLFRHALEVTSRNFLAHNNLGVALFTKGQTDKAILQYQEALRILPNCADAHYNLGNAFRKKGQTGEALRQFEEATRLNPNNALAQNNFGAALFDDGRTDEAISRYHEALRLKPDYPEAHFNLGVALGMKGQIDEATQHFQEALRLKPDYVAACFNLGIALGRQGRVDEAARQFQEALRLNPDYAEAHFNLSIALGRQGQTEQAIRHLRQAIQLKPDYPEAHRSLEAALASQVESSKPSGSSARPE